MELEGRLNPALSLPEILQFLSMGKMTGTLTVTHGNYTVLLHLRSGKLVNSSSLGRPRKLGQMLVNQGLVQRQDVEEALRHQKTIEPAPQLGQILIDKRVITKDQLRQAIRLQLEEEMWDLFSLQEGAFKFDYADESAMGEVLVELDVEPLIIEGTRRLDEWVRIVRNIPGDNAVPSVRPLAFDTAREEMQFTDREWRVMSLVNGFYTLGSIANRSGIGKFETYRVLNSFLASGYISIRAESREDEFEASYAPIDVDDIVPKGNGKAKPEKQAAGSSSARILAMFVRKKAAEEMGDAVDKPAPVQLMDYPSPVAFVGAMVNALAKELCAEPEFYVGPRDDRLVAHYSRGIALSFPKADLLQARGNRIDVSRFDRYVELAGVQGPFEPVVADTLEALGRLLKMFFALAVQRLGLRPARRMFGEFFADFRQRSTIRFSEDFYFQEYSEKVTE
jgi:hypothetical protein